MEILEQEDIEEREVLLVKEVAEDMLVKEDLEE